MYRAGNYVNAIQMTSLLTIGRDTFGTRLLFFYLFFADVCMLPVRLDECSVDVSQFHSRLPLILKVGSSEFYYPRTISNGFFEEAGNSANFRVACTSGFLEVFSSEKRISAAGLKCNPLIYKFEAIGSKWRHSGTFDIERIRCTRKPMPEIRRAERTPECWHAQIGFQVNLFEFIPVIDDLCSDEDRRTPTWVHAKIVWQIESRQTPAETPTLMDGVFINNVTMSRIFNRDHQRAILNEIIGDADLVDSFMPHAGDKYFVRGQLISKEDMFYQSQQDATHVDVNIVPIWRSINDGNWELIGDVIRNLATDTQSDLEVWAGSIDILRLSRKKIFLHRDVLNRAIVQVPKILFKCVYDRKRNRGLVFLTVNNPHLLEVTSEFIICERYEKCDAMYPEFSEIKQGYTYCCSMNSFAAQAKQLGIRTFPNSTDL